MKSNKSTLIAFILLVITSGVSRMLTFGIAGLAPQMSMAIFGGAVIKNKKLALALPLLSLLISDVVFELLYQSGLTIRAGFYKGQWGVYLCFIALTFFGFLMKKINVKNVLLFSVTGSLFFFITTNFFTWIGGGGFGRPLTFEGMMQCYGDALAYYRDAGLFPGFLANFVLGDIIWSIVLFGCYYLLTRPSLKTQPALK